MKVFFNMSARSLKELSGECKYTSDLLCKWGYILTYSQNVAYNDEELTYSYTEEELQNLYTEAIRGLNEADIAILELSVHSFTQGYLVNKALDQKKPVIGLHHSGSKVAFAKGIVDDNFQIYEYDMKTLPDVLKEALDYALEKSDIRFNMMLSSKLNNYLKWVSRDTRVSRATFIRSLLQSHMSNNPSFVEK